MDSKRQLLPLMQNCMRPAKSSTQLRKVSWMQKLIRRLPA
jgi:hypothetical protein